jgi:hypothetical protein
MEKQRTSRVVKKQVLGLLTHHDDYYYDDDNNCDYDYHYLSDI